MNHFLVDLNCSDVIEKYKIGCNFDIPQNQLELFNL